MSHTFWYKAVQHCSRDFWSQDWKLIYFYFTNLNATCQSVVFQLQLGLIPKIKMTSNYFYSLELNLKKKKVHNKFVWGWWNKWGTKSIYFHLFTSLLMQIVHSHFFCFQDVKQENNNNNKMSVSLKEEKKRIGQNKMGENGWLRSPHPLW